MRADVDEIPGRPLRGGDEAEAMHRPVVVAVARDGQHRFSKTRVAEVHILAGLGVEGDAHLGVTVRHRSRPTPPRSICGKCI
jgi:hypothetical protein